MAQPNVTLRTLDLGCGRRPRGKKGFEAYGLDLDPQADNVQKWDAVTERIPFPDNHFNRVYAHDFLEHLPKVIYKPVLLVGMHEHEMRRINVHIELFNEVWRVLRPHGCFEVMVPVANNEVIHGDPTHLSVWCANSFNFYCAKHPENFEWELMKSYGFKGRFHRVSQELRHGGSHLFVIMAAMKNDTESDL